METPQELEIRKANGQYPYWIDEFEKEYPRNKFELWYYEGIKDKDNYRYHDTADAYRVFMILCNNLCDYQYKTMTRQMVIDKMKAATEENPIQIEDEFFYTLYNVRYL